MRLLATALLAFATLHAQPDTPANLLRVAEEADAFQENISKTVSTETLVQRTLLPPSRFQPRVGASATTPPKIRERVREIVSEYSVGGLHDSDSHDLVEFRQVISVDGKPVQTVENARRALSLNIRSADDQLRKRMLEDFAKHGLVDVATEYGLILLAFTKRGQENIEFGPGVEGQIGADAVITLPWKQKTSEGGELEFHGRQSARRALTGTLWVRASDSLPLRIQAWAESVDRAHHLIRDEAVVEYVRSPRGFLTPASVVHRHLVDGIVATENLYRYEPFKLFTSDAEIKFTEIPEDPAASPAPPAKKK